MKTFSFRAECQDDVDRVLSALREKKIPYLLDINRPVTLENGVMVPDVDVELRTDITQEDLIEVATSQVDCHVIAETIREVSLADNSLERRRGF